MTTSASDPMLLLLLLAVIVAMGIAGLITVIVWPLEPPRPLDDQMLHPFGHLPQSRHAPENEWR